MSAVIDQERAYRPINGSDAIEAILMEFRKALTNSGMFPLHRVWHEFEFQGGVRVEGWATKTEEVKFAGGDEVGEVAPAPNLELVDEKVGASLSGEPPSVTRERLAEAQNKVPGTREMTFEGGTLEPLPAETATALVADETSATLSFVCGKCGRESASKAGNLSHERFCKVEPNVAS